MKGVSIGALTMACLVLGELGRISDFLDPGSDDTGLLMDKEALPRRIHRKRGSRLSAAPARGIGGDNDGGVGF